MAYYRPSDYEDCAVLAPKLRDVDLREIQASSGSSGFQSLAYSYWGSYECNTIISDKEDIIGMFGVAKGFQGVSFPWLLMSDGIYEKGFARQFIPQAQEWVDRMQKDNEIMTNWVSCDNRVAIRWLKSLGFSFINKVDEFGVGKKPFYEFVRIRRNV